MARKLAKSARREQLLVTAQAIVREEGTDALTLGHLAERAGVSKPIAYEHFGTRSGLLIALCRAYDERQAQAQCQALKLGGNSLGEVLAILAAAYVDCMLSMGPEVGAAYAALAASEEMEQFRQAMRESYAAQYRDALAPFLDLPAREGDALIAGLLGAAEALAQDAAAGRLSRDAALAALTAIMSGTLQRFVRPA